MAYDAARKEVVLFGGSQNVEATNGQTPPVFFNDTWAWDGTQWQQKVTTAAPSGRMSAKIQYNPVIGQVVLIGGYGAVGVPSTPPYAGYSFDYREETWTWNGSNWTQQFPDQSPPFSWNYGLVYDSVHNGFFAFLVDDLHLRRSRTARLCLDSGTGAILLGSYQAAIPLTGGSGSITITASVPWMVSDVPWINITSGSGGADDGIVSYNVTANTSSSVRSGTITIAGQTFTVTQAGQTSGSNITVGSAGTNPTIQLGYNKALTGNTIEVQSGTYPETDNFSSTVSVTLIGGYDSSFSNISSIPVINGTLQSQWDSECPEYNNPMTNKGE